MKSAIISSLFPGIISILGFIITYISMKKSFINELKKQKNSVALEKMSTMPFEVLTLMDEMIHQDNDESKESSLLHFQEMMNTIYSYGSEESIRIISTMQKENYAISKNPNARNIYRMMSLYVLLATQIKYDVTEIAVCPKLWFEMRITDYKNESREIIKANNQLVKELKLNDKFIICD
ncbi:MAG: hypothetical protein HDT46_10275 [Ruminococcaceae bacterium]|nr:hypothetical protein [Oscillospiraceae bacterium]